MDILANMPEEGSFKVKFGEIVDSPPCVVRPQCGFGNVHFGKVNTEKMFNRPPGYTPHPPLSTKNVLPLKSPTSQTCLWSVTA